MRVYILGVDGYLGWPLRTALLEAGHRVSGCDNLFRRTVARSLIPLMRESAFDRMNVAQHAKLLEAIQLFKPDAIVHFAEVPSAPYSMKTCATAQITQGNNVAATLSLIYAVKAMNPDIHILKLGSMGEYIPSSWYHLSKVHDSENLKWACKNWGLRCTDVMQGPVCGVGGRFDYDEEWGTVINRWVCMGVSGHPILVYGSGEQVRGFLPIQDSIACFQIALENPPEKGEYRVINQYAEKYRLNTLAKMVAEVTHAQVEHINNPRIEDTAYEGDVGNGWLISRGYQPTLDMKGMIESLVESVWPFKEQIDPDKFRPSIVW